MIKDFFIGTPHRKMFWGAIAALILILILLPGPKKIGIEAPTNDVVPPGVRTETVAEQKTAFTVDAEYPQLEGMGDEELQTRVNDVVKKEVMDSVADFKKEAASSARFGKSEFELRYTVAYVNENLFSLALQYTIYTAGSAHPASFTTTMNFDLRNGKKVGLEDLFQPDSEYLKELKKAVEAELDKRFPPENGDRTWIEEGVAPTEENYAEFLVEPDNFVVIFNPYQVTPGAAGTQKISVPYAVLAPYIEPAGILAAR